MNFLKLKRYKGQTITEGDLKYKFLGTFRLRRGFEYIYLRADLTDDQINAIKAVLNLKINTLYAFISKNLKTKVYFRSTSSNSFYFLYNGNKFRVSDHLLDNKNSDVEIIIMGDDNLLTVNGYPLDISNINKGAPLYQLVISHIRKVPKRITLK